MAEGVAALSGSPVTKIQKALLFRAWVRLTEFGGRAVHSRCSVKAVFSLFFLHLTKFSLCP